MTMENMEGVLSRLLVADNNVIQQATEELKRLLQAPGAVEQLCAVLGRSSSPQVRQYAAVILRKRLAKARQWAKLGQQFQDSLKQEILRVLAAERERFIKNSIAQLVGTVAKHELPGNKWPTLLEFLSQTMLSENLPDKELGIYTLSIISQSCAEQLRPHIGTLLSLFAALLGTQSPAVHFYVIQAMTNLTPVLGTDELAGFQSLLPAVLTSIGGLARADEEQAAEALDLVDALVDQEVALLLPHVPAVVELCLRLAADTELGEPLRCKALHCVDWLTRLKKKVITKHKLVEPILAVVVPILCTRTDEEEEENELSEESNSVVTASTRLIDSLAINLPPEKLLTPLLQHVQQLLTSNDEYQRKAAFLALAMTAEGCSERVRTKHLAAWLQHVCQGIQHPSTVVRNAALFTLGQFAEHLQPDISKYAAELMPVLYSYLASITATLQSAEKDPPGCDRMFYALETFCETLGEEVLPYLPPLMQHLLQLLQLPADKHAHVLELAISAIGALGNAAREGLVPYFEPVMMALRTYLLAERSDENQELQVQALDTLGVLAKTLGADTFGPLCGECMALGISLVDKHDDPDMRRASYGLFASVSTVMKEGMLPFLPKITEWMCETLASIEGVTLQFRDEEGGAAAVLDLFDDLSPTDSEDLDDTADDDDEDEDVTGYNVENSYLDEKEDALNSLRILSEECGAAFLPHLEKCFDETYKLLIHPQDDIRKAAVDALTQFCVALSRSADTADGLQQALSVFVPKMHELVKTDDEAIVVMSALDGYAEVLKSVGAPVLQGEGHLDAILNSVRDVMSYKTTCQDQREDDEDDSEYDEMLIEYAGDVVPSLGRALPTERFLQVFMDLYPALLLKTKRTRSDCERSFSVGCLAECLEFLGEPAVRQLFPQLLAVFLPAAGDAESDDVQSNAVFGLGELACRAGSEVSRPEYPAMLSALSGALASTKNQRTRDNICGAVARLIIADTDAVPMDQVFPVFVSCLPLREDFAENETVFRCLGHLYGRRHPCLGQHMGALVSCAATVHGTKQEKEGETARLVREFVLSLRRDFPAELEALLPSLAPELAQKLALIS
ncbi:importin-4-like [Pollicipes pollicipes]|uniref:importin-4-like n=1 Tax=Pollicipes pollicipes TaxID=41117 RepID=UPI00188555E7|nr:importin-4-like [Pollicipes pollicipes]